MDRATGVVFKDDLLAAMGTGDRDRTLSELEREALFVPASLSLAKVLPQLLEQRQQLAIVVDEYGVTAGVVTVEDLLETLLGLEIMDEKDSVADLQRHARERWETRRRDGDTAQTGVMGTLPKRPNQQCPQPGHQNVKRMPAFQVEISPAS